MIKLLFSLDIGKASKHDLLFFCIFSDRTKQVKQLCSRVDVNISTQNL